MTIDEIVSDSGLERITPVGQRSMFLSQRLSWGWMLVSFHHSDLTIHKLLSTGWRRGMSISVVFKKATWHRLDFGFCTKGGAASETPQPRPRISNRAPIGSPDIIHLGPSTMRSNLEVIAVARQKCRFLALDVQGMIRRAGSSGRIRLSNRKLDDHLNLCDAVKASWEEARVLTSTTDPISMVVGLLDKGPKFALVTLGSKGAVLGFRDGILKVPLIQNLVNLILPGRGT